MNTFGVMKKGVGPAGVSSQVVQFLLEVSLSKSNQLTVISYDPEFVSDVLESMGHQSPTDRQVQLVSS